MGTRWYVRGVRAVAGVLTRLGLVGILDRHRHRRVVHWLRSLLAVHDVEEMVALDVPWWSYRAIDEVERWLKSRTEVRVFEWGSGASTAWLAARANRVTTVEHHAGFASTVRRLIPENVGLEVVPAVRRETPAVPSRRRGHRHLDFEDYVGAIDRLGGTYDLICIDGRAREACLDRAVDHLGTGGIIVFDNTNRSRYRRAMERHPGFEVTNHRGLTPALPYPSTTSLMRRHADGSAG